MKALKFIAISAMFLMSLSAWAVCPTQETTVVFINGVWTTEKEAIEHTVSLLEKARAAGISKDCVHFAYSHTQDDGRISDIVEAMVQKSVELNLPLLEIVRAFFITVTVSATQNPALAFALDQVIITGYERELALNEAQATKHLNKFKSLSLNFGQRGIMATHSQGGLYGNRIFDLLSPEQKANTRMVSATTPAAFTAGSGPNTRLSRDGVANRFFLAGSLEGVISNATRFCDQEEKTKENSWECHGFDTGYLHDIEARNKIIADIIAVLPTAPPTGTIVFSQLDGSETLSRPREVNGNIFNEIHFWVFQNLDSFTGTLNAVEIRTRIHPRTTATCNYSSRMKLRVYNGDGFNFTSAEQDITPSYENYVFNFSAHHIPIALSCRPPSGGCPGLHNLEIVPIIPENACPGWYYAIDIAGVNSDVSLYISPDSIPESFPADPYIVVTETVR